MAAGQMIPEYLDLPNLEANFDRSSPEVQHIKGTEGKAVVTVVTLCVFNVYLSTWLGSTWRLQPRLVNQGLKQTKHTENRHR